MCNLAHLKWLIYNIVFLTGYKEQEVNRPQCSPECTATKAIFSQTIVNVACKKINLSFAMATNQIQQLRFNSYGC